MVFDALLDLIFGAINLVLGLLPDYEGWQVPPSFLESANNWGGQSSMFYAWVDTELLGTLALSLAVIWLSAGGVRFTVWLYEKLPFKGT
jgi:hypothetical protein